jgi:hypothetical protein
LIAKRLRAFELGVEGGRYSLSQNFSYRAVGPPLGFAPALYRSYIQILLSGKA